MCATYRALCSRTIRSNMVATSHMELFKLQMLINLKFLKLNFRFTIALAMFHTWPVPTGTVLDGVGYRTFYHHRNFYIGSVAHEVTKQYLRQCNDREQFKTFYGEISYVVQCEVRKKR